MDKNFSTWTNTQLKNHLRGLGLPVFGSKDILIQRAIYSKMTVTKLKEILREQGLKLTGRKVDIIKRLEESNTEKMSVISSTQQLTELPSDLVFNILLPLTDENLANMCQTNKAAADVCSNDLFWNERIKHIFDYKLAKYKGKDLTYKEIYDFFRRYDVSRRYNIQTPVDILLFKAAELGHLGIVKYLIKEKEANIHYEDDLALVNASYNGHLSVVKYLLARGANIHARNDEALVRASAQGNIPVIQYLLDNGADIKAQDILATAPFPRGLGVVKYLVNHGAIIYPKTFENIQKLSTKHKVYLELAQYLEQYINT